MTRRGKKGRLYFRGEAGRFASPGKAVSLWRGHHRLPAGELARRQRPALSRKTFPKGYRSPFKRFVMPAAEMKANRRVFALLAVESVRTYEGERKRGWIPLSLPLSDIGRARRGTMTEAEIREEFARTPAGQRGRIRIVKVEGIYGLRTERQRRRSAWTLKERSKGGKAR